MTITTTTMCRRDGWTRSYWTRECTHLLLPLLLLLLLLVAFFKSTSTTSYDYYCLRQVYETQDRVDEELLDM